MGWLKETCHASKDAAACTGLQQLYEDKVRPPSPPRSTHTQNTTVNGALLHAFRLAEAEETRGYAELVARVASGGPGEMAAAQANAQAAPEPPRSAWR